MATIYASFNQPAEAAKAAGALLDHGVPSDNLSILTNESWNPVRMHTPSTEGAEGDAKHGITTTTGADAAMGAVKGSIAGMGIGGLAALASMAIPGVGIVVGGGALAIAMAGALGATVAGAAAGGVHGYLKDQGVGDELITSYSDALAAGGSLVAVECPAGKIPDDEVEQVLAKYGATHISTAQGFPTVQHRVINDKEEPIVVAGDHSQHALIPDRLVPVDISRTEVRPTVVDPVSGNIIEGTAIDPVTGIERPVRRLEGTLVYHPDSDYARLTTGLALENLQVTEMDADGNPTAATMIDPVTGENKSVRILNGSLIYADYPTGPSMPG
jgi:hypothetical protein